MIATTIGVLFAVLPSRAVEALVAVFFLGGAVYAFLGRGREESRLLAREGATRRRLVTTAFVVVLVGEWGI